MTDKIKCDWRLKTNSINIFLSLAGKIQIRPIQTAIEHVYVQLNYTYVLTNKLFWIFFSFVFTLSLALSLSLFFIYHSKIFTKDLKKTMNRKFILHTNVDRSYHIMNLCICIIKMYKRNERRRRNKKTKHKNEKLN